mmetsp:Transcript_5582/g.13628  ORF Transcript_5582/g.13628 Transcript_5582/m.13628 type:complete len:141 (-) Transcript_5582:434-856(-)
MLRRLAVSELRRSFAPNQFRRLCQNESAPMESAEKPAEEPTPTIPTRFYVRAQRLRRALVKTEQQLAVARDEDADDTDRESAMQSTKECFAEYKAMLVQAEDGSDRNDLEAALRPEMMKLHEKATQSFFRRFDIGWRGYF